MSEIEFITTDEILALEDLQFEDVVVPEWKGKKIRVRGLSGIERDAFEESILLVKGTGAKQTRELVMKGVRAKLLVRCLTNEGGTRLFSDSQVDALGAKSGLVLDRLFAIAQRLSGLSKSDVEELAGN